MLRDTASVPHRRYPAQVIIMDVVDLAAELVRIPSINPAGGSADSNLFGEAAIAGKVKSLLRQAGASEVLSTYPIPGRPNVTAFFNAGADKTLLFEAHLDTVPVDGMTIEPFSGEVRGERLWGRGACDVKGPMAAMIAAIASEHAAGTLKMNVIFAAVCDEEAGFSGVRHMLKELPPKWREGIQFAIVAEPTDLQPVVAHKGVVRWAVEARGVAAHSSTPQLGRNAIYMISHALQRLEQHAKDLATGAAHPQLGPGSLSVGLISGGSAVNIVPDFCRAEIDRRLIPGETPDDALQAVLECLRECTGVEVTNPFVAAPPLETPPESSAARACLAAADHIGIAATPQHANYCTDASFYPEHGIEAVVFGPGSIRQAHTADEHIELRQLRLGVEAYRSMLRDNGQLRKS